MYAASSSRAELELNLPISVLIWDILKVRCSDFNISMASGQGWCSLKAGYYVKLFREELRLRGPTDVMAQLHLEAAISIPCF